jgi:lipopolysaccharide cholinephosphotransferase
MKVSIKEKKNVNKGIFLDVFPLDALPNNPLARKLLLKRVYIRTVIAVANSINVNPSPITRVIHYITSIKLFHFDIKKWDRKTEKIISSVELNGARDVGLVVRTVYPYERVIWRKECFHTIEWVPFEFFQIPIPSGFDEILTVQYGDYMKYPPVEKRGTWHSNVVFEPDIPYKQYEQL